MMLTDQDIYQAELRRWIERYEHMLDQVPQLLEVMRQQMNPLKAGRFTERVSGGGRKAPLPFREDRVDDCDDLWAALVEYIGEVGEKLGEPVPDAVRASWGVSGAVRGVGGGVSADGVYRAGFSLIVWLIDRATRIRGLGLADSEDHLFSLIRKLVKRYVDAPPVERPAHRRVCTVCGERAVTVAWLLGDAGVAECRVCGAVYEREGTS